VPSDFDLPDIAFAAPKRANTTMPLQALTLLNHRFTLYMAAALAGRLRTGDAVTDAYGHPKMNSFNHPALASVAAWVWRHIAGIQAEESSPGFKHFTIAPKPVPGVSWIKASYDTVRGRIESNWEIRNNRFTLRVTIPPNTTATAVLLAADAGQIHESGKPLKKGGLKTEQYSQRDAGGQVRVQLASGTYTFELPISNHRPSRAR
jgi:hypothetical protein